MQIYSMRTFVVFDDYDLDDVEIRVRCSKH